MVVTLVAVAEEVVVDSITRTSHILTCNQLTKYLDSSLEERIHLLTSLMMTMISLEDKDSGKWEAWVVEE
jgi:hypothetical protein